MLFSSYAFIFLFVPATMVGYYAIASRNKPAALAFLIAASLFFYASWRPLNVLIILPSIAINFALVCFILRTNDARPRAARIAFWAGIAFNIAFLGYFKYSTFLVSVANDVTGASLIWDRVILPLGISFITFQKIALLVDVRAGVVTEVNLRDYALFVLFFPQLIAGPIVHFRELMPQFAALDGKPRAEDFAVGLTLFFGGLFKKVVLADPLAILINPIWAAAAAGAHPALLQSWAASLGYLLQLYFDFSGYSDMAIGSARLFGIKLPANFDSPLKAPNVIEYWSRWHMTLTRFLTAYVFTPVTLALMRAHARSGRKQGRGRRMSARAFATTAAFPLMLTMFLSGLWHGAGYQFLVFGLLHGAALVVCHAWRTCKPARWPATGPRAEAAGLAGWAITFLFVLCAEIFFRAASVATGLRILAGMAGSTGLSLPPPLLLLAAQHLPPLGLHAATAWGTADFLALWLRIVISLAIVLLLPNSLELLAAYDPALGFTRRCCRHRTVAAPIRRLAWSPRPAWAVALSALTVMGVLSLGRLSDFLYWHF
jgi:D-alanyl-lipoteichoic acid acyltransferase DltB (MBOAT superfamily)